MKGELILLMLMAVGPEAEVEPNGPKPTIIIDPGHGGRDPGAVGNGLEEKAINLQIARKLEQELKKLGYGVVMTRSSDEYLSLAERSSKANKSKGEIFISIHTNSFTSSAAKGIETFHFPGSSKGKDLASFIQNEVIKATKATNRGVKSQNFHVLRETTMPAALLEVGFISNPEEAKKVSDSIYQDKIIDALIRGINQYFEKY